MRLTIATIIIFLALPSFGYAQLRHTGHFYKKTQWLCTESIILDSTGLFFHEWGCESDSRVTFGRYTVNKAGRLNLRYQSLDSLVAIREIKKSGKSTDSTVVIRLFDRYKKLVSSSFRIVLFDTAGKAENLWLDETGLIRINRFKYTVLILDQLSLIYQEVISFPIEDQSMEIHFNLPSLFMSASQTSRGEPKPQKLLVKMDGLYNRKGTKKLFELLN